MTKLLARRNRAERTDQERYRPHSCFLSCTMVFVVQLPYSRGTLQQQQFDAGKSSTACNNKRIRRAFELGDWSTNIIKCLRGSTTWHDDPRKDGVDGAGTWYASSWGCVGFDNYNSHRPMRALGLLDDFGGTGSTYLLISFPGDLVISMVREQPWPANCRLPSWCPVCWLWWPKYKHTHSISRNKYTSSNVL